MTPFPAHPGHAAKGKVPCSRPLSVEVKYIGMDVHKEAIAIAVMNEAGKVVMESIIETKLYDLLKPHVAEVVVCDPRKNALLKEGNKSDKIRVKLCHSSGRHVRWKAVSKL